MRTARAMNGSTDHDGNVFGMVCARSRTRAVEDLTAMSALAGRNAGPFTA